MANLWQDKRRHYKCLYSAPALIGSGRFSLEVFLMPTFPTPTPLTQRITEAKHALDQVRQDGHKPLIEAAQRVLDGLIDKLPRGEAP